MLDTQGAGRALTNDCDKEKNSLQDDSTGLQSVIGVSDFLVEIEIETGNLDSTEVNKLRRAEAVRARELAALGHIVSIWRVSGRWANVGIWRAKDEATLWGALDSLPLRPYMSVSVTPLEPHPSDPQALRRDSAGRGRPKLSLPPLPDLVVRSRSSRISERASAATLEPLPKLSIRSRVSTSEFETSHPQAAAGRRASETKRMVLWSDVDVTGLAKATPDFDVLLPVRALVKESLPGHLGTADTAVEITESGLLGVDGFVTAGSGESLVLDIGGPRRAAAVRMTALGDEGIQIRTFVRITVTAPHDPVMTNGVAALLQEVRRRIESGPATN